MEIQYLREFIKLAETENYAVAAEEMFVSQSSLFKHIKMLENELGVSFFEKKGKHIQMGEFGKIFLPYAKEMVILDGKCKKKIQSKLEIQEQRIRIWTNYHIGDLAARFRLQHEEYLLDIRQGGYDTKLVSTMVESRGFELYFLSDISVVMDSLICMPYLKEKLVLAVHESHPLAGRESVSIEELENENFILFHDFGTKEGEQNPHNRIFKDAEFVPKNSIRVNQGAEIVNLVKRNCGVAVLSGNILRKKAHEGIVFVDLEPKCEYGVWCCYHKDLVPTHGMELLLDFCRREDA